MTLGVRNSETVPSREPITVTIRDALSLVGIGRTRLYELIASGEVTTVKLGRRRLVHLASLKILVSGAPAPASPKAPTQLPLFAGEEEGGVQVEGKKRKGGRKL